MATSFPSPFLLLNYWGKPHLVPHFFSASAARLIFNREVSGFVLLHRELISFLTKEKQTHKDSNSALKVFMWLPNTMIVCYPILYARRHYFSSGLLSSKASGIPSVWQQLSGMESLFHHGWNPSFSSPLRVAGQRSRACQPSPSEGSCSVQSLTGAWLWKKERYS